MSNTVMEISRLKKMLDRAGIPYEISNHGHDKRMMQLEYFGTAHTQVAALPLTDAKRLACRVCSVIQGPGSYGYRENLLEIMGLLTKKEEKDDRVRGFLSAEDVFERIRRHYRGANDAL